jgi:hypothetical protein
MAQDALTPEEWDAMGDTRVLGSAPDVPAPESKAPYDFENTESHGFPSEHNLHPDAEVLPEEPGEATQVFNTENVKSLKAKVRKRMTDAEAEAADRKAMGGVSDPNEAEIPDTETDLRQSVDNSTAHPKSELAPSKSIDELANEDAERILGRKPLKPPVTGTMEGKPVQSTTIKVPDAAQPEIPNISDEDLNKFVGEAMDKGSTPGVPGKTMTPAGVVEDATGSTVRSNGGKAILAEDDLAALARGGVPKSVKTGTAKFIDQWAGKQGQRLAAQTARDEFPTVAEQATNALKTGAKAAYGVGKAGAKWFGREAIVKPIMNPINDTRSALEGFGEAGNFARAGKLAKGAWALGKGAVKGGLEAAGGFIDQGLLEANYNKLTYGADTPEEGTTERNKGLLGAQAQYFANKQELNRVASKYGMRVTGSDPSIGQMLNPFFDQDPDIQVHEDPALKAAFQKRNAQRLQDIQEQQAVNPDAKQ